MDELLVRDELYDLGYSIDEVDMRLLKAQHAKDEKHYNQKIEEARKEERERIEGYFDSEPTHCTFVKLQSVEECYVIRVKDWQALKGEQ